MNLITLSGRLTKDVETRTSTSGTVVSKFSLAVTRPMATDKTDFFNCTAFGKTAESIEKYLKKGNKVIVSGYATIDEYTDKNGNKARAINIIVNTWEFAESKGEGKTEDKPKSDKDGFMVIPDGMDEELPFA